MKYIGKIERVQILLSTVCVYLEYMNEQKFNCGLIFNIYIKSIKPDWSESTIATMCCIKKCLQ